MVCGWRPSLAWRYDAGEVVPARDILGPGSRGAVWSVQGGQEWSGAAQVP